MTTTSSSKDILEQSRAARYLSQESTMASVTVSSDDTASTDALSLASDTSKSPPFVDVTTCTICRYPSWTEKVLESEEYEISCNSFSDLRSSAESGCAGCEIMKQGWEWGMPSVDDRNDEQITFNRSFKNLHFHLFTKRGVINLDVFTLEGSSRFKHLRVASLIPLSTHIDITCNQVRQWTLQCEQQHTSCQVNPVSVPQRLLDLKTAAAGFVRLVETSKDLSGEYHIPPSESGFRYACLSHCWGSSRSKHLTRRSNLDTNMRGIPVAELPRTFRDAIKVSEAVDIRYLWIDSLCIVQDHGADWEAHVKLMADIYRNAYITLAAGASEDDEGGFFRDPEDIHTKLHSFQVNDGDTQCEIYMRRCLPHPDQEWPAGIEMPLMSRGWVFQERLLSKRFLCFARNEILWECQEDIACSCSTSDAAFNHRISGAEPSFLNCWSARSDFSKISQLSQNNLLSLWRDMITQYTHRQLTYPSDKLPALAGLAKHFKAAGAGTYLQGLWLEAFETHLLWQNNGFSAQESRPRKAPSWSWVSAADGDIVWDRPDLQNSGWQIISVPVHDIATERNYHDPKRFPLEVRGNLSQLSLELENNDSMKSFLGYRFVNSKLTSATESLTNSRTVQGTMPFKNYRGNIWTDYKFWTDETSLWNILADIYFLEAGIEKQEAGFGYEVHPHCWVAGLLLRSIDPEGDCVIPSFERIGWLRFCTETSEDQWKPLGTDTTFFFV